MKFYFTYGTDSKMPFRGGWTIVEAASKEDAIKTFNKHHPLRSSQFINCSSIYKEETFKKTEMYKMNDNLGAGLQEVLKA